MQTTPDYVGKTWKWLSEKLGSLMTDQWHPTLSDDAKGYVVVSGSLVDKAGENRSFSVLMTKDGTVIPHRSSISEKRLTTR